MREGCCNVNLLNYETWTIIIIVCACLVLLAGPFICPIVRLLLFRWPLRGRSVCLIYDVCHIYNSVQLVLSLTDKSLSVTHLRCSNSRTKKVVDVTGSLMRCPQIVVN